MSASLSSRVLWCFLILLLPLPVYKSAWYVLPVGQLAMVQLKSAPSIGIVVQLVAGLLVITALAWAYRRVSAAWPARIRGSIVGLVSLSMLIIFSSLPVYLPFDATPPSWVEFRDLYTMQAG